MQGVRGPIPVPGTCWGRARFASNSGRQVLDSGARHLLGRARFASNARRQVPDSGARHLLGPS